MFQRREHVQGPQHSTVEGSPGVTSRQYRVFRRRKRRHRDETTRTDSSSDDETQNGHSPPSSDVTDTTSDDEAQNSRSPTSSDGTDPTSDNETQNRRSPTSSDGTDPTSDNETQNRRSPTSSDGTDPTSDNDTQNRRSSTFSDGTDPTSDNETQNRRSPTSSDGTDPTSDNDTQNRRSPTSSDGTDPTSDNETQNRRSPTFITRTDLVADKETQTSYSLTSITTTNLTSDKETECNYNRTSTRTSRKQDTTSCGSSKIAGCLCIQLLLVLFLTVSSHYVSLNSDVRQLQQEVKSLRQWMNMFHPVADTMANLALESQGATVLSHLSSDTYWPKEYGGTVWDRISDWWYSSKTQRRVIQGHSSLHPGECWSFEGDHGDLFISLSHPASITHVTLGHVTKSQSLSGDISSAPRTFSIYGMKTTDEEGTYLGTMVYDKDGTAFQTFRLLGPESAVFSHVKLQIQSNWGHRENTCIYSFRVHGNIPSNI